MIFLGAPHCLRYSRQKVECRKKLIELMCNPPQILLFKRGPTYYFKNGLICFFFKSKIVQVLQFHVIHPRNYLYNYIVALGIARKDPASKFLCFSTSYLLFLSLPHSFLYAFFALIVTTGLLISPIWSHLELLLFFNLLVSSAFYLFLVESFCHSLSFSDHIVDT